MREIKFRAWIISDKKMVSVVTIRWDGKKIDNVDLGHETSWTNVPLHDLILMQFTGIKDRHGKDICDGDIVQFVDPRNPDRPKVGISIVQWFQEGCAFECAVVKSEKSWGLHSFSTNQMEVIGTIHENPELLGDAKCD